MFDLTCWEAVRKIYRYDFHEQLAAKALIGKLSWYDSMETYIAASTIGTKSAHALWWACNFPSDRNVCREYILTTEHVIEWAKRFPEEKFLMRTRINKNDPKAVRKWNRKFHTPDLVIEVKNG